MRILVVNCAKWFKAHVWAILPYVVVVLTAFFWNSANQDRIEEQERQSAQLEAQQAQLEAQQKQIQQALVVACEEGNAARDATRQGWVAIETATAKQPRTPEEERRANTIFGEIYAALEPRDCKEA